MFSQKESFFKGKLFYIIFIGLFIFGYWVNQGPESIENPEGLNAGAKHPTENSEGTPNENDYDIMDNIIGGPGETTSAGAFEELPLVDSTEDGLTSEYYLVKEIDGIIKVFHYDKEGKETLFRNTDIAFSFLSLTDQVLFQKGVIKNSMDELNELLQDFES